MPPNCPSLTAAWRQVQGDGLKIRVAVCSLSASWVSQEARLWCPAVTTALSLDTLSAASRAEHAPCPSPCVLSP